MVIPEKKKKRFICTFVKKNEKGEFVGNVIVIPAHNEIIARSVLCETYKIPNVTIKTSPGWHVKEGVKSIRLAETNVYEGDTEYENFRNDS